ncbi:putative gastric mucin-like protein [Rosellinia necatrix]|uniref:Putative gastric mucin-like protein n=1 Tax=Rosellinia necatrix TaxID=77044 RepID=A0A1S7UKS2_ROSNE|nr:putative gastric mucin-like protein [Rosellinia necatrix]
MAEQPEYYGSLIAFEGPRDTISTQLRLLPNSPKVLILPPFEYFVKEDGPDSPFDARLQVLRTHEACDARTEMARKFLRDSAPDNKRLVFMNGGTVSAQMNCIYSISKHETDGDMAKAEAIFNDLIQNGITGLKRQGKADQFEAASKIDGSTCMDEQENQVPDDPISKAMRAADALDLETAFLQENHEFDITPAARPRSISVPALPIADDLQNAAPFYVFGPTENAQRAPPPSAMEQGQLLNVEKWRAMTASEGQLADPNTAPASPNSTSEAHLYDRMRPTSAVGPPRASVESMPSSPALLGEAFVVDVRPFMAPTHKRIKSVDRIYATAIRNQDISICKLPQSPLAKPDEASREEDETREKENNPPKKPILRSNFYTEIPRTTFVKTNRTIVRKCVPSPLSLGFKGPKQLERSVRQGIDTNEKYAHQSVMTAPDTPKIKAGGDDPFPKSEDHFELDANEPFQTVLPIVEDIVIYFKGDDSNPKLETMVEAFKHGTYPISMPPLLSEAKDDGDQPGTPTTRGSTRRPCDRDLHDNQQALQESVPIYTADEYDPFVPHGASLWPTTATYISKQDINNPPHEAVVVPALPTLAQTPPLKTSTITDKIFHDFDIKECKTAVCIQNSLRSILNAYFPSEDIGYHRFNFPLLPELSSFWQPVFRETSSEDSKATRKIDLILAIGAQRNVARGLLGAISDSLEKLGREPDGASRSGRLNLRYLIANSMQAFTSQPLANQTQDNPFTNPLLLATLIIPHLETYIAAHSATRFLILEYPPEYLSTVLALQHLIGVDLLKVAGIVDAEAGSPKSHLPHRAPELHTNTHSASTSASTGACATLLLPKRSKPKLGTSEGACAPQPSFSKANFIITSTATESEIATLISTIWQILIDISTSYIPRDMAGPNWKHGHNNPASQQSFIPSSEQYPPLLRAATMLGLIPSPDGGQQEQNRLQGGIRPNYVSSGTYADLPISMQRPITPAKSTKASVTETLVGSSATRVPRTPKTAYNQRNKLRNLLGRDPAADGSEIGDVVSSYDIEDEDDGGQFAAEERKYMPLWSSQGPRKGNSRKALKWLGLST